MIFRKYIILCSMCLAFISGAEDLNEYSGATVVLRPVLFRSEFVSRGTLRALQENSKKLGYTVFGYPDFGNAIITRNLSFWETKLAQTQSYSRYLNKVYRQYYIDHPNIFSEETIEAYIKGASWNNPKLIDGTELHWHHGKNGYELIPTSKHQSLSHEGGAKTWGHKYAEGVERTHTLIPHRDIILTARRWGKFAALDLAFSTIGLAASGEISPQQYIVNTASSATAGCLAWGVESLIITAYPLTQGSTPIFIGSCMINIGGPASWIASGVFFLSKYGMIAGWNSYQQHIAMEVERQCRQGEKLARFALHKTNAKQNNETLRQLILVD